MNRHQRRKARKNKDFNQTVRQDLINAIKIHTNKDFKTAEKEYKKILTDNPNNHDLIRHLGILYQDTNRYEQAYNCFLKAIKINPKSFEAHNNLGSIHMQNNNMDLARKCFEKSIEMNSTYVPAINNLSGLYIRLQRKDPALKMAKKALTIQPENPLTKNQYAKAQILNNNLEEAINILENLCKSYPDFSDFSLNLSSAYKENGDFEKSNKIIRNVFEKDFTDINFFVVYASNKSNTLTRQQIDYYENIIKGNQEIKQNKVKICEAFFEYYRNKKEYKKSNEYLTKMNQIQFSIKEYNFELELKLFESMKNTFKKNITISIKNNSGVIPIFICGMPRSGTTLCEQILSSHSLVSGAGELNYLATLSELEGLIQVSPDELKNFTTNISNQRFLSKVRKGYLEKLTVHRKDNTNYICDKMPHNFIFIGFIRSILPEAKIIYCKRDSMDNCFSLYTHKFLEMSHQYSYDQRTLAEYYKLHTDLMAFWLDKYKNDIYVLDNEELINNQEKISKELVKFCNLEWEEECLKFYETKRQVRTASIEQVRQPLNTKSIGAWKKYESSLTELINQLK